jgi:L-malate glycosyltransferase
VKILFITNLYPYDSNFERDKNTKALYNITRLWREDTEVLRPMFLPTEFRKFIKNAFYKNNKVNVNDMRVHIIPIFKIPSNNVYFFQTLVKYVKKHLSPPDVVLTHRLHCAQGAAKIAKLYKKPLILGLHQADILLLQKKEMKKYYEDIFEQAVLIPCRSHSILRKITNIYPKHSEKVFVAFSGIDPKIINPINKSLDKLKNWKENKKPVQFITAANLKKLKNIDINLRALAMLGNIISWRYTIIGDGPEMETLKTLVNKLGISDNVLFVGKKTREEVLDFMDSSDIFLMVSEPETFGLSYIESMSKGCLVIGAFNNGIDGIVEDGMNGFLCKPRSVKDLFDKIKLITEMETLELSEIMQQNYITINKITEENAANSYLEKIKASIYKYSEK